MVGKQSIHRVNDVDLNVVEAGDGLPVLIFLHYWGGSSRTWAPVIELLSQTNRCVAIDFRGWGKSTKDETDFALETLTEDVVGVFDELSFGRSDFVIVGHSMGGKVAQIVASRQPAGLQRLVLVAPAPPTPLKVPEQQRQAMLASYESRRGAEQAFEILSPPAQTSDASRESVLAYREQVIEDTLCGAPGAKRAWTETGMVEDICESASKITVPVKIVVGTADNVESEASLRIAFGKVIPNAEFVVLPGVGHLVPLEATADVVDAIRSAQVA